MKRFSECMTVWAIGGIIYYMSEIIFRGFSHWSMFILGGLCTLFFALQGIWTEWRDPLWIQIIRCTIFITAGEFMTGIIVNKWLHWNIWDYSDEPFQLFGQVCLPFMILFSGMALAGILFVGYFLNIVYGEQKPDFHVI